MPELKLERLDHDASKKIRPFLDDILENYREKIHSIHVTGTALTADYDNKVSDVNSIFVLKEMDLKFLELMAPMGKKYGRDGIAAPLIMTPEYIRASLDVFPIEFLNFTLLHSTVYGDDILDNLEIGRVDLRHQCERDLKTKLIWLRQGYLSSLGDKKLITEGFVNSITGYIPLFRGIIVLLDKEPPLIQNQVLKMLGDIANINTDVFSKVLKEKYDRVKFSIEELYTIFEDYYAATEELGKIVDDIKS